jgi:hypothetical protein
LSLSKDQDDKESKSVYTGFEWDDKKTDWTLEERGLDFDFAARIWSESPATRLPDHFCATGLPKGTQAIWHGGQARRLNAARV